MRSTFPWWMLGVAGLVGCGGATADAPASSPVGGESGADSPAAGPSATAQAEAGGAADRDEPGAALPTRCVDGGAEICTPRPGFAKRLCEGDFPTVALHLFAGGTPWTKAYLARKTKAWSASGAGSSNEEMPADEEVVVLLHRGPPDLGGIQVSGATGGYEVLRWDGTCVTLQQGELLFDPPARPKIARIVWKRLELDTRDALKEEDGIREAYLDHRKHCKGVSMGEVSIPCVKADHALGEAIARYVRDGGKLAPLNRLP